MEDYGWLIFVFLFWVATTFGEMRKAGKKRRKERDGTDEEQLPRRPDPAASRRRMEQDLGDASKRAAEALRRWEERQVGQARSRAPEGPARVEARPSRRPRRIARSGEAAESRRDAYEAIADMLGAKTASPPLPVPVEVAREPTVRRQPTVPPASRPASARSEDALPPPARVEPRRGRRGDTSGADTLSGLERYPPLQRAIVLTEIFGTPASLR